MSQIADITVFDGASTPVTHTLKAMEVTRESGTVTALWQELNAAVPSYAQIRAVMKKSTLKSGVVKTEFRVVVPVMEAILNQNAAGYTAAPKVAYEDTIILQSFAHPRSTVTSRRLTRMLGVNIANNISTSVAAASTGPYSELYDSLVSPT